MNTRSCSRAVASQVAPPVEDRTPASLGIEFTEDFHHNRFNRLKDREIKSTKWVCPYTLNQLGLGLDFNLLCNNVGLLHFVFQDAATYRRLTLEFLSTLRHTVGPSFVSEEYSPRANIISFQLMNREYNLSLDQWCQCFGFVNNITAIRNASFMIDPPPYSYFNRMRIYDPIPTGSQIECPVVHYLHYVIANTL